jgi:Tfp pilus assembly protein PilV
MRSTDARARRRRRQSGQTLIEPLVASVLLGIALVVGLSALDVSVLGARRAVHAAWAQCMGQGEVLAVSSSSWSTSGYPAPAGVTVAVALASDGGGVAAGQLQKVTVQVFDPDTSGLALLPSPGLVFYKSRALSGADPMTSTDTSTLAAGCARLLRGA